MKHDGFCNCELCSLDTELTIEDEKELKARENLRLKNKQEIYTHFYAHIPVVEHLKGCLCLVCYPSRNNV